MTTLISIFNSLKKDMEKLFNARYKAKLEKKDKIIKNLQHALKISGSQPNFTPFECAAELRNALIWRLYKEGMRRKDLAIEFGISETRIDQIREKIKKQLKHPHFYNLILLHRPHLLRPSNSFKRCDQCGEITQLLFKHDDTNAVKCEN